MATADDDSRGRKRLRFFLLSYLCFFMGALFSAADGSFSGMGIALAIFFLFMALMNFSRANVQSRPSARPVPPPPPTTAPPVTPSNPTRARTSAPSTESFPAQLKHILRQARAQWDAAPDASKGRIVSVIFISAMIVFFMAVFFSVGSDDATSEGEFIVEKGQRFYDNGDYDSAARYYRMALELDPSTVSAFRGLGNVKMSREEVGSPGTELEFAL